MCSQVAKYTQKEIAHNLIYFLLAFSNEKKTLLQHLLSKKIIEFNFANNLYSKMATKNSPGIKFIKLCFFCAII